MDEAGVPGLIIIMTIYKGRCPICSGELGIDEEGIVVCENNDYTARAADFESLWEKYINSARELSDSHKLLEDLQKLNTL